VEWSGEEWSGVEWSGVEWSAVEWSGVECSGVERHGASKNIADQRRAEHARICTHALIHTRMHSFGGNFKLPEAPGGEGKPKAPERWPESSWGVMETILRERRARRVT
jgi:hypothetical protein